MNIPLLAASYLFDGGSIFLVAAAAIAALLIAAALSTSPGRSKIQKLSQSIKRLTNLRSFVYPSSSSSPVYSKLPCHLAFSFVFSPPAPALLAALGKKLADLGIQEITFFDLQGECVNNMDSIAATLAKLPDGPSFLLRKREPFSSGGSEEFSLMLVEKGKIITAPQKNRFSRSQTPILINLLDRSNSLGEIMKTIRNQTEGKHKGKSPKAGENPIEQTLEEGHRLRFSVQAGPSYGTQFSPHCLHFISECDLLVSLSTGLTIGGFPAWLVRVAEIYFIKPGKFKTIENAEKEIQHILHKFEKTVQRGGT